mmetsp:Transcript_164882/g.529203  ORF Transcript_164882/g.529203 Transcript_164882/m.529203 type:complete len:302 (+) Transcript_164882:953-1858(+)
MLLSVMGHEVAEVAMAVHDAEAQPLPPLENEEVVLVRAVRFVPPLAVHADGVREGPESATIVKVNGLAAEVWLVHIHVAGLAPDGGHDARREKILRRVFPPLQAVVPMLVVIDGCAEHPVDLRVDGQHAVLPEHASSDHGPRGRLRGRHRAAQAARGRRGAARSDGHGGRGGGGAGPAPGTGDLLLGACARRGQPRGRIRAYGSRHGRGGAAAAAAAGRGPRSRQGRGGVGRHRRREWRDPAAEVSARSNAGVLRGAGAASGARAAGARWAQVDSVPTRHRSSIFRRRAVCRALVHHEPSS